MTLVALIVHFGTFFAVVAAGIWLERRAGTRLVYRSLPQWARLVVAGVAFGIPWIPYSWGLYPALPPDPLHWVVALNAVLWSGSPLVLARVLDIRPPEGPEAAC